jgi:hypothetical protein
MEKQVEKSAERINKMVDVDLITFKNSLVKDQKNNDLLNIVKDKLQSLPVGVSYKNSNEFILWVCKLVENIILKDEKINKKDLVISILKQVLNLNDIECKALGDVIEFLHSNNMIQKIKVVKKIKKSVYSLFEKKVF